VLPAEKLPWWLYVSSAAKSLNIKSYVAVGVGYIYLGESLVSCLLSQSLIAWNRKVTTPRAMFSFWTRNEMRHLLCGLWVSSNRSEIDAVESDVEK
jgi:hypothetical protein